MFRNSFHAPKGTNCLEFDVHHTNCILSLNKPLSLTEDKNVKHKNELSYNLMCELLKNSHLSYLKRTIYFTLVDS